MSCHPLLQPTLSSLRPRTSRVNFDTSVISEDRRDRERERVQHATIHPSIHSSFALLPHRAEFTLHLFHTCVGRYDDAATYYSAGSVDTAASVEDGAEHFWMFIFTHLTAIYCFGSSAAMHHFGTHAQASPRQLDLYLKMDYIGISLGMLGPFIPGLTLGFWCHPLLQKWYVLYCCTYCTAVRPSVSTCRRPTLCSSNDGWHRGSIYLPPQSCGLYSSVMCCVTDAVTSMPYRYLVAISLVVGGSICIQLHPSFGSKAWVSVYCFFPATSLQRVTFRFEPSTAVCVCAGG